MQIWVQSPGPTSKAGWGSWNPSTREIDTGGFLGLTGKTVCLVIEPQGLVRDCLKKQGGQCLRRNDTRGHPLPSTHMHAPILMNTHTHILKHLWIGTKKDSLHVRQFMKTRNVFLTVPMAWKIKAKKLQLVRAFWPSTASRGQKWESWELRWVFL